MKHIYIFCFGLNSSGMLYGIGAYIQQLIEFLKNREGLSLNIVELYSDEKEFCIKENDGYRMLCFPQVTYLPDFPYNPVYYRNVWYILQSFIVPESSDQLIFHLNYNSDHLFINFLKHKYPKCLIFYAVHYLTYPLFSDDIKHHESYKKSHENDKLIFSLADKIICLSDTTKELMIKEYGVPDEKIQMIYNGLIDEGALLTEQAKKDLRVRMLLDPDDFILLFVGRVEAVKGVDFVIEGFRKILDIYPNARLIIAGNGTLHKYIVEADGCWSRITFTGHLKKEKLYDFYRIADVGVIPYFKEQCSYVVIEMMMNSLPLVTTDEVFGMLEPVNTEYAVPVQREEGKFCISVDKLVDKILKAFQAKQYQSDIRKNYENRFTLSKMKNNYFNLYGIVG